MESNQLLAEIVELQARCAELGSANETLREQREHARYSVDLLMHENQKLEERVSELTALIDRLRIAIQQGAEL